ncbi:MAG: quinolinate synthase NadA [Acidobacteria bacterium]|nr:quinolinate synthase NadA [Acidobacteriota bacterium]
MQLLEKRFELPVLPDRRYWTPEYLASISKTIRELKLARQAVILAHNYMWDPVKEVADFVGDSLGLSQQASRTEAKTIVFCGVHFMAETAAIICPEKLVLLPELKAGCSLSSSITVEELRDWKALHAGAIVVSYVNTSAEVKAESDYCCTSSNAEKVIRSIPPHKKILFLPDKFLGYYLAQRTGRDMEIWQGQCHVHAKINARDIDRIMEAHPYADLLIHPECGCVSSCMYRALQGLPGQPKTYFLSTEGMTRHVRQSKATEFAVATEIGILDRMRKENPDKHFIPVNENAVCEFMKTITPESILRSLEEMVHPITVPSRVAHKARLAIERMLALT